MKEQTSELPKIIHSEIANFSKLPEYFIQDYHTHLLCLQGFVEFKFNGRKMKCEKGDFFFWFSKTNISEIIFSKNFKAKVLLIEHHFLNDNFPDQNWSIAATMYSRENPLKKLWNNAVRQKILDNFNQIYDRFEDKEHRFYEEVLRLQMHIFILEMWNIFASFYEHHKQSLQTGTLYERFIHLVQEHCLQEREVQFYAEKLNITPKYLNLISKNTAGITASESIKRNVRERLIFLLENKNLNIAEIADEMNFSSRSFFTRYVRKLVGMTPTDFRKRME